MHGREIIIFGLTKYHDGITTVTNYVSKFLRESGKEIYVYDINEPILQLALRKRPQTVIWIGHWKYCLTDRGDIEMVLRSFKDQGAKLIAYNVTEGEIPQKHRAAFDMFDEVLCPSSFSLRHTKEISSRVRLMPHGVDPELFRPKPMKERHWDISIVCPRRVGAERKGSQVTQEIVDFLLPNYTVLTSKDTQINHTARIQSDSYESMPLVYSASRLFLWASPVEGFGLPVLEAMMCGTPVVYSDAPAHNEFAFGVAVPTLPPRNVEYFNDGAIFEWYASKPEDYICAISALLECSLEELEDLSTAARTRALEYDYRKTYLPLLELIE